VGCIRRGVLDFARDRRRGRGSLGGEFAATHCNQWGLCCVIVWNCVSFGVVSGVGPGIHVLDGSPRASKEGAVSSMVFGVLRNFRTIPYNGDIRIHQHTDR